MGLVRTTKTSISAYETRTKVLVFPSIYAITVAELKEHLRITHAFEDNYLDGLIKAGTGYLETYLGRRFITHEMQAYLDIYTREPFWSGIIEAPSAAIYGVPIEYDLQWLPLQEVTEVATYNQADVRTVFDSSKYRVDNNDQDLWGRVVLNENNTWSADFRNVLAIETLYKVGYGDTADDVPDELKHSLKIVCAYMYTNRGDCSGSAAIKKAGIGPNIAQYRVKKI